MITRTRTRVGQPGNGTTVASMIVCGGNSWPHVTSNDITLQGNSSLVANQGYYVPFIAPYDTKITAIAFTVVSGTNNHDIGLYDADGTFLVSRGATALTAAAVNTWTLGTPQPVREGQRYWVGFSCASATPVFDAMSGSNQLGMVIHAADHPLPTTSITFGSMLAAGAALPVFRLDFES